MDIFFSVLAFSFVLPFLAFSQEGIEEPLSIEPVIEKPAEPSEASQSTASKKKSKDQGASEEEEAFAEESFQESDPVLDGAASFAEEPDFAEDEAIFEEELKAETQQVGQGQRQRDSKESSSPQQKAQETEAFLKQDAIEMDFMEQMENLNKGLSENEEGIFIYSPKGRRSPFEKPADYKKLTAQEDSFETLSGLEGYNAESFKVTSIMWNVDVPRALLKDPSGKTYLVSEGIRVGRKEGYVAKIREGEVVIVELEKEKDSLGGEEKKLYRTQVLKIGR